MTSYARNIVPTTEDLRILIVDNHALICETLAAALNMESGIYAESATSLHAAHDRISETARFDVVLLDYEVTGMDGMNGLRHLIDKTDSAVVLFASAANPMIVDRAIDAGAGGFIPKTLPFRALKHALRLVAEGVLYLPAQYMRATTDENTSEIDLTPREMRVLGFLCEGMQNKEIGRELDLDDGIVKMDVRSICRKMGARNRTQIVIEAMKRGLPDTLLSGQLSSE